MNNEIFIINITHIIECLKFNRYDVFNQLKNTDTYYLLGFKILFIFCVYLFYASYILFIIRINLIPIIILFIITILWLMFVIRLPFSTLYNFRSKFIKNFVTNTMVLLLAVVVMFVSFSLKTLDHTLLFDLLAGDIIFGLIDFFCVVWVNPSPWDEFFKSVYGSYPNNNSSGGMPPGPNSDSDYFKLGGLHENDRYGRKKEGFSLKWYQTNHEKFNFSPHASNRIIELSQKSGIPVEGIIQSFHERGYTDFDIFKRPPSENGYTIIGARNGVNSKVLELDTLNTGNIIAVKITNILNERFRGIVYPRRPVFSSFDYTVSYGDLHGRLTPEEKKFLLDTVIAHKSVFKGIKLTDNQDGILSNSILTRKEWGWWNINNVISLNNN